MESLYFKTLEYWIEHNKSNSYSIKIMNMVLDSEKYLSRNPYSGQEVFDMPGVRYIVLLKKLSVFYRIKDNIIEILSFWDGHRNPQDLIV